MVRRRMILTADITSAERVLGFCLEAVQDSDGAYKVEVNDTLVVDVYVLNGGSTSYKVHMLNISTWVAPSARGQAFDCLLGDTEARMLSSGITEFGGLNPNPPLVKCAEPTGVTDAYTMTMPNRLILNRIGRFAFIVSVTLVNGDDGSLLTFPTTDPELDVGGTYPPD